MSTTPQRITRSRSSNQTPLAAADTAPGPPIPARGVSTRFDAAHLSNPFRVDLVIPYSIALGSSDRLKAQSEAREGYELLLRALEGEGGLKVATRAGKTGKGKEEVWVFVGAEDEKVDELVEQEKCVGSPMWLDSR